MSPPVSVLILTYNEEINLPRCVASLSWCNDIVVLDSYSDDNSVNISEKLGAKVFQRKFDNYASQRNFGLTELQFRNPWVLMVDADEEVAPDLVAEIGSVLDDKSNADVSLFRMRRKDYFLGRWIRRSSGYPTWFGRLIRLGHVRVERTINEQYVTDGPVGYLQAHLLHYPFNKGFSSWFDRHNRYSTMEAEILSTASDNGFTLKHLFSADPVTRRGALKQYIYNMPGRPLIVFAGLYFFRGGFLDGLPGLVFCLLKFIYECMISCKVLELKLRRQGCSV